MKLTHKLILWFLAITLLIWLIGYLSVNMSQKILQESIIDNTIHLAGEVLDAIDIAIHSKFEVFQEYSENLILQEAVSESNREFEKLDNIQDYINRQDQKWVSAPEKTITPFMQELINNKLSEKLRKKTEFYEEHNDYKVFGEVFVTNKYGANVAQTGKTTDYRQDDEEWWQTAKRDGLYIKDVEYDESADVYSIDIGIRIDDEDGNFIGAMKVALNIEEAINIIKELKPHGMHEEHRTMHYKLATKDGKLIYSTEEFEFFEDISAELVICCRHEDGPEHQHIEHQHIEHQLLEVPEHLYVIKKAGKDHEKMLFVHAHSKGYKDFKSMGWTLMVAHKTKEIFAPVAELRNRILISSVVVTILAILMGFLVSISITNPIIKLKNATVEIGRGNLDTHIETGANDEIGQLAASFKKMTKDLKKITEYLKTTNTELSTLYKVSSAISQTIDMNELFATILDTITGLKILNVEHGGEIFLLEGNQMKLAFHLGQSKAFLDLHKDMKVGDCLCGLAAKTGEIIISKDPGKDSRYTMKYPGTTPYGHISIPLKAKGRVTGVLSFYLPPDIDIDKRKVTLLRSIADQIGIAIDNSKLYEEKKLLSLHDPLTGFANRSLMDIVLNRSFARAKRFKRPFSVLLLDIDYFKKYNDTYGHIAGDKLLVEIANIVLKEIRKIDLAVRYGGEEFLILLPETELTKAYEIAERVRKATEAKKAVTISIGISSYHKKIQKAEDIINKADSALYKAKQKGRNRTEVNA